MILAVALGMLLLLGTPAASYGQSAALASQLSSETIGTSEKNPSDAQDEALRRIISVHLEKATVEEALRSIARKADLRLSYGSEAIDVGKDVTLSLRRVEALAAMKQVLEGTGLQPIPSHDGELVLIAEVNEMETHLPGPVELPAAEHRSTADLALLHLQQQGAIRGTVVDSVSGDPLPGVNVTVVGTQRGASTGANGQYLISSLEPGTYTLRATFIGFDASTRSGVRVFADDTTTVDFALSREEVSLDELVVVGYGESERRDLTGSVASISSEELEESVSGTFEEALQGRVPGLTVTKNSGKPGGGISVNIRGVSSLNGNNQPLYVIDGVPISAEAEATTDASGVAKNVTNALATLNPEDIESIEVLKDASASAIYGARAANGVVLITTKRGQAGETRVSYDGSYGIQQLPQRVDVMNLQEFARFQNARAEALDLEVQPELADPSLLGEGTDWQGVLFRNAPMYKHNLRMSGGNEGTQYMLSLGYFDQEGIAVASWFRRYSMRLNLDNQSLDWLKVGTSLNLSRTRERINVSNSDLINLAVRQRPDVPVKTPDGEWGGPSDPQFTLDNPVGMAKLRENFRQRSQLLGNIYAEVDFSDHLSLRNELDGNFELTDDEQFTPTYEFGARTNGINTSYRASNNSLYWMLKNYLTYRNTFFDRYDLKAMVGHEAQEWNWEGLSGSRENFPTNNVKELNAGDAATDENGGYAGDNALESFFGRLNVNYEDRYLLTTTLRADGSSRFGPNNRWGYFPSFSAAWVPSEEPFLEGVTEPARISNLKLRLGYGLVGNQDIGNYLYGSTLSAYATPWGSGFLPNNLANPDLKWESTESYNVGVDLGLLNQRVDLTVDAYLKRTKDLLLQLPLPPHAGTSGEGGFSSPMVNIGSIENKGVELSLRTVNLNGPFSWNSKVVFSANRNEVTGMNTDSSSVIDRAINFTDVVSRTTVGQPVGRFYGYVVEGVFEDAEDLRNAATPPDVPIEPNGVWVGDYKFKDLNNDGIIDDNDRTFIGNPQPDFTFGVSNDFSYKNFRLSFFINGTYGNDIFNDVRRENENPNANFGMLESVGDYARLELKDPEDSANDVENVYVKNPDTMVPRLTTSDANDNYRVSDRFVEDGSYLRIKNVTFGYDVPSSLINVAGLNTLRLYLKVQNLYTFTGYSGYDPEVGSYLQDPLLNGVDDGRYPSSRTFTFGVNVGM